MASTQSGEPHTPLRKETPAHLHRGHFYNPPCQQTLKHMCVSTGCALPSLHSSALWVGLLNDTTTCLQDVPFCGGPCAQSPHLIPELIRGPLPDRLPDLMADLIPDLIPELIPGLTPDLIPDLLQDLTPLLSRLAAKMVADIAASP